METVDNTFIPNQDHSLFSLKQRMPMHLWDSARYMFLTYIPTIKRIAYSIACIDNTGIEADSPIDVHRYLSWAKNTEENPLRQLR